MPSLPLTDELVADLLVGKLAEVWPLSELIEATGCVFGLRLLSRTSSMVALRSQIRLL